MAASSSGRMLLVKSPSARSMVTASRLRRKNSRFMRLIPELLSRRSNAFEISPLPHPQTAPNSPIVRAFPDARPPVRPDFAVFFISRPG